MIRGLGLALLAVLAVVLQGTLLYSALPGGVTPDLALLLVMLTAWRYSSSPAGLALGLWCGALVGASSGQYALLMALLYGLAGWMTACVAGLHHKNWQRATLLGAAMAASARGLEAGMLFLAGARVALDPVWLAWHMLWHGLALGLCVGAATLPRRRRPRWTAAWVGPGGLA